MFETQPEVVVAGHVCLDVIPDFVNRGFGIHDFLVPGKLIDVGAAALATGGAVSNTGLALHRLGISTRLMGKVGDDLFGQAIFDIFRSHDPTLVDGMIVSQGEQTSYSIVINPPGVDRIFLHCPGTNHTFCAADVEVRHIEGARLFHFGYPPLMRRMYEDGGAELADLFKKAKASSAATSLDMANPDPDSAAGKLNWHSVLRRILPFVDIFLPSVEEILFMLDRDYVERLKHTGKDILFHLDASILRETAEHLLEMGAAIVGLKLGSQGLYVRTTSDSNRLAAMGKGTPKDISQWIDRELLAPCFGVDVRGTTGAGDCTIAGFLAGFVHDLSPEDVLTRAVAVGACNVEAADASSGILGWSDTEQRIVSGWSRLPVAIPLHGWTWNKEKSIWVGSNDSSISSIHCGE